MAATITAEEEAEYLKDITKCPKCRSNNIESGAPDVEGRVAWTETECKDCKFEWTDFYYLSGVEAINR